MLASWILSRVATQHHGLWGRCSSEGTFDNQYVLLFSHLFRRLQAGRHQAPWQKVYHRSVLLPPLLTHSIFHCHLGNRAKCPNRPTSEKCFETVQHTNLWEHYVNKRTKMLKVNFSAKFNRFSYNLDQMLGAVTANRRSRTNCWYTEDRET